MTILSTAQRQPQSQSVVDVASDNNFDDVADQTVSVSTTDDVAGFTVAELKDQQVLDESGTTDTFTVVLNAQPDSDVVVAITSSDTEASSNSPLTFTSSNWDTPQTVTVTGVDDFLLDGTITSDLVVAIVDASSDNNFDGVADQTVFMCRRLMMMLPDSRLLKLKDLRVLHESGTTDTITAVLNAQPDSDVVPSIISSDTAKRRSQAHLPLRLRTGIRPRL